MFESENVHDLVRVMKMVIDNHSTEYDKLRLKMREYVNDNYPCTLCKRMIINAGIEKVVMRDTKTEYRVECVEEWIKNDDTMNN